VAELLLVAVQLLVEAVIHAVFLDLPALLVPPVNLVNTVNPVPLVSPVIQVNHQFNPVNLLLHHHANHAHKDHPAHLDLLVLPVMLELLGNLVPLELMLLLVNPDQRVHPDLPVNPVLLEPPVNLVPQLNLNHSPLAHPDHLEMLDHLAHPDPLVPLETMELLDNLDQKAHLAQTDNLVPMETLVHPDKLAHPVVLEKRVSAPNTAPSMVVSSSKMELVVKLLQLQQLINTNDHQFKNGLLLFPFFYFVLYKSSQFVVVL